MSPKTPMIALSQMLRDRRLVLIWGAAVAVMAVLGIFRIFTDAKFALASAAIIPVYFIAWAAGFRHGFAAAMLAAMMWLTSSWLASPAHGPDWIAILNGVTQFLIYLCVAVLTARVRELVLHEAEAARRESLTGLLNRRAFHETGQIELLRAARYGHPFGIVFIDLNHFKRLNDDRGHQAGDQALQAVALALSAALRKTDHMARLGGDEFGIFLPEIDRPGAAEAAQKIAAETAAALRTFPPVSASIGFAWFESPNTDFDALLNKADDLMYQVKREGRGGVCLRHFPDTLSHYGGEGRESGAAVANGR